jgi:hypothetical protein
VQFDRAFFSWVGHSDPREWVEPRDLRGIGGSVREVGGSLAAASRSK